MNEPFKPNDLVMLHIDKAEAVASTVQRWKAQGLSVAFVPTMGALHDGHLSLVELALTKAERCVVSIFVNPTQFAPHEDFDSYPRDVVRDLAKLQHAGVHMAYTPDEAQIYPDGDKSSEIKAGAAAQGLESDFRPHFFDGVVNVVSRLFAQVQPDIAIFGEKDFQQLQVITEMVETLALPIQIIGAPIARDKEGLALSSRNAYLSADELAIARQLNKILRGAAQSGDMDAATQALLNAGFDKVDYVSARWGRILGAAWLGKTRLIDNLPL
jgi:pantoate--beta-alanine ligase